MAPGVCVYRIGTHYLTPHGRRTSTWHTSGTHSVCASVIVAVTPDTSYALINHSGNDDRHFSYAQRYVILLVCCFLNGFFSKPSEHVDRAPGFKYVRLDLWAKYVFCGCLSTSEQITNKTMRFVLPLVKQRLSYLWPLAFGKRRKIRCRHESTIAETTRINYYRLSGN